MSTTARLSALLAAFLVGVFVEAYRYHGPTIDAYLHTSHLHVMDWMLLLIGSLIPGRLIYDLVTQPDTLDWRRAYWFVASTFMIYAALGNNATLKEVACNIFSSHPYHSSQPCYYQ
jgi:hypothetical protein